MLGSKEIFTIYNRTNFDVIVCRATESISTELDGETAIVDDASGKYSDLDPIGTFIWNQMTNPLSVGSLRDAILERYDVTKEKCIPNLMADMIN